MLPLKSRAHDCASNAGALMTSQWEGCERGARRAQAWSSGLPVSSVLVETPRGAGRSTVRHPEGWEDAKDAARRCAGRTDAQRQHTILAVAEVASGRCCLRRPSPRAVGRRSHVDRRARASTRARRNTSWCELPTQPCSSVDAHAMSTRSTRRARGAVPCDTGIPSEHIERRPEPRRPGRPRHCIA